MRKSNLLVGTTFFAVAIASAQPAFAQDTVAPATDTTCLDENVNGVCDDSESRSDDSGTIVVTGSRIARPNLESAVPIISVDATDLIDNGATSLGDALSQLPALRSTFTLANSTGSIGTAGLNILDLRGLGTTRTLVLVNGRRHVTAQPGSFTVDVNTIPTDLLQRVDVVTGGNSAVYGSDAVAGVVNFILRRDYEGIKLRAQAGVSNYNDRGAISVSAIAGKNFLDDRLNIAVALEYSRNNPLFFSDRDYLGAYTGVPGFVTDQITTAPNRNFDGVPNTRFVEGNPGITFGNISLGGYVLTACPAATATNAARVAAVCTGQLSPTGGRINNNYAFQPDGRLLRDVPAVDLRNIGGGILGGFSASGVEDAMLIPGVTRYAANLLMSGDFSPAFQPFLEAKYVHIDAIQQSTQPTFIASTLNPVFSVNNPFLTQQARDTLAVITGGASTFTMQRFNNDFGTRAENHDRDTYRLVVGVGGELNAENSIKYEVAFNYGRTETYYETGGNVILANFNRAKDAVRNTAGQIVCAVNNDAITTNDDAACVPINLFGFGAPSQAALDYVLFTSSRNQEAEQINATAFISGNTTSFFNLPGGPVGYAVGVEYRRETASSVFDAFTTSGATFLNAILPFNPPAQETKEAFAELRLPLLADVPFFHELSVEGAARVSDYNTTGAVWAYNVGATWAPIPSLRFRGSYARSVRAPTLTNLFATRSETFNAITDPCNQTGAGGVQDGPNRAANCAAAGIPTTIVYTADDGTVTTRPWTNIATSTIAGFNQGNPDLQPERGTSWTIGGVFTPEFLPGFALSIDYYKITVRDQIAGLTGQAIVNRCYDDPGGIDNPFCSAVFRRATNDVTTNLTFEGQSGRRLENRTDIILQRVGSTVGFINQPFNFAKQVTSGVDADVQYRTNLSANTRLSLRGVVSWVERRESFSFITTPERSDRFHGTLGDPVWAGSFTANVDTGVFDFNYNLRYVGKQIVSGLGWETFFPHQGRPATNPDARPFAYYDPVVYHNIRIGIDVNSDYRFYMGVDNVTNELPPFELTGTGNDAIYPNTGRFFFAGVEVKF